MAKVKSIVWFRQDLRLSDNPALRAGVAAGEILPIFILDDETAKNWKMGGASRVWLHHSLLQLNASLNGKLSCYRGSAGDIIDDIVKRHRVAAVYWNRCYEPWRIKRDQEIKERLIDRAVLAKSFNGSLLWEPWEISKSDGTPYRVFTPFYRRGCLNAAAPRKPLARPRKIIADKDAQSVSVEELGLLPAQKSWDEKIAKSWQFGEAAAGRVLDHFLNNGLGGYKGGRDIPSAPHVSRLSPYLHWGEISPNTVWHKARAINDSVDVDHFCSEIGWREFSYALLYHFPELPTQNFQPKFDAFQWIRNQKGLRAWQQGKTGIPIIDAGMRELWQTGYMHNRVRMIVASFLVKNLMVDWREGEKWFWDTLVDADLANNSASWQWVAGSGADAAPYFRIFNPVTQSEKFDPNGIYIHRYVPELSKLKGKALHAPWAASDEVLAAAGVSLGKTYPKPIADLKTTRVRALDAFKSLSGSN